MCCIPCKSYNKVADESGRQEFKTVVCCGLCQANSLLFGNWELISEQNQAAYFRQAGGMTERNINTLIHKKQIVQIKPGDHDDTWLYRLDTEAGDVTFLVFKFGIELNEVTPLHIPAKATYIREGKNKVTTHYVMYDGRRSVCTREVKWWRPNRLVTKMILDNVLSVRQYRRIRPSKITN